MSGTCCANRPTTWEGSAAAPSVPTARVAGNYAAAPRTPAPPTLRPRRRLRAWRRHGLRGLGWFGLGLRVCGAVLPDDGTDDIGIIVGPDALARIGRDDGPIRVIAERVEVRVRARADDDRRGEEV